MKRVISGMRWVPTVLLVDDRRTNLVCLKAVLEPAGYRLHSATSGAMALGMCRTNRFDIVLLDVLMPGMDGIELAERLRATPSTKDVPLVFVTAAPAEVSRFSQYGREDVALVPKPIDTQLLEATVGSLLAVVETRAPASAR